MERLYPLSTQNRLRLGEHGFKKGRLLIRAIIRNFLILQLLFLALFSYVFGALYQQTTHTHNLTAAFVDYDQGAIGSAIRAAYSSMQSDAFPTLVERSASDFPSPSDLESAVCDTRYWGALYVSAGASNRLQDALAGGPPAMAYDGGNALIFIWNEARYSAIVDSAIFSNAQALSSAARVAYSAGNRTGQVPSILSAEALPVLVNPWELKSVNIQPTSQGSRAIYNTLVIILILLQDFFYLGTINGLHASFKLYINIHPTRIILLRGLNSLAYCLVGSLCTAGAIWAFRSGWNVNGNQFALTWATLWLFAHLNFLTLDVFTVWLPGPYVPMALISWVITNITSILLPFELSPGFFQLGYVFPAHEVYQILLDIWSGGCNPQLRIALPVLFAWELVAMALSALGVYRRSHYATLEQQEQTRQFNDRLEAAMAFERKRAKEIHDEDLAAERRAGVQDAVEKIEAASAAGRTVSNVRRELAEAITAEDKKIFRERKPSKTCGFGPAFDLPFGKQGDSGSTSS